MSKATETLNTRNQLNTNYDFAKIFVGENDFKQDILINASGGELTYLVGTLLGRISASGKLQPLKSAAVDGSQYPVGILAEEITLANAAEDNITHCVGGDVVDGLIIFDGADTNDTVVDGRRLADRIAGDTLGIYAIDSDELTDFDNQ